MSTLAEVILSGVYDNSTSDDGVGSDQGDEAVLDIDLGLTVGSSFDVSEITNVTFLVLGSSMVLTVGVEVSTGGYTSLGNISKLVHMETVEAGLETSDGSSHGNGATLSSLGEGNASLDLVSDKGAVGDDDLGHDDDERIELKGEVKMWLQEMFWNEFLLSKV